MAVPEIERKVMSEPQPQDELKQTDAHAQMPPLEQQAAASSASRGQGAIIVVEIVMAFHSSFCVSVSFTCTWRARWRHESDSRRSSGGQ